MGDRRSLLFAVVVALAAAASVAGPATRPASAPATNPAANPAIPIATPAEQEQIDQLVGRLGTGAFPRRQAAEDELVALGEIAKPALVRAAGDPAGSAERRSRAESALGRIAEQQAWGPSLVTVRFDKTPTKQAIEQIFAQAGRAPVCNPPNLLDEETGTVTLDAARRPFWEVMGDVARQTGLELRPNGEGLRLMRTGGKRSVPPAVSGAFVLLPESARRYTAIQFRNGGAAGGNFAVQIQVLGEPKLPPTSAGGRRVSPAAVRVDECLDDAGRPLVDPGPGGTVYPNGGGWTMSVNLRDGPQRPKSIRVLRGQVTVPIEVRSETVEFEQVAQARNVRREAGGAVLVVEKLETEDAAKAVTLHLQLLRGTAEPSVWQQMSGAMFAQLTLLDAEGKKFVPAGSSSGFDGAKLDVTISFRRAGANNQPMGEPAKLVWKVPTEVRDVAVPFEFHDLPLPP
jgi:hypothetical protein